MTRLRDHYHHLIDVVVAAIAGVAMAIFIMISPLRSFDELNLGKEEGETGPLLGNSSVITEGRNYGVWGKLFSSRDEKIINNDL